MTSKYLRRYMHLPALIHTLRNRSLSLLNPDTWDDRNDAYFMRLYREKKNLETVLAACFSQVKETYHHWRIFAPTAAGVCVRFKRAPLIALAKSTKGVRTSTVEYLTVDELESRDLAVRELPFLKRYAYENEGEYRFIYESADEALESFGLEFPLSLIDRITLSPWMGYALFKEVKAVLRELPGCRRLDIRRSTLISNEDWKTHGDAAG